MKFDLQSAAIFAIAVLCTVSARGQTDGEIRIGVSTDLKGKAGVVPAEYVAGARVGFDAANASGGVAGRKIKLIVHDNDFEPRVAVEDSQRFVDQNKVHLFFGYYGSQIAQAVITYSAKIGMPFLFPAASVNAKDVKAGSVLFSLKPSTADQVTSFARFLVETLGFKDIGILHQSDAFGIPGRTALVEYLRSKGITPNGDLKYDRESNTDVADAVKKFAKLNPKAVVLIATAKNVDDFIGNCIKVGFKPTIFATSNLSPKNRAELLGRLSEAKMKIYFTEATPSLEDSTFPVVEAFKSALKNQSSDHDSVSAFEGYLASQITLRALAAAGNDLKPASIIKALESLSHLDLGGVTVEFSPTDHQAFKKAFLMMGEGKKVVPVRD